MEKFTDSEMRQKSYDFSQRVATLMQDEINALSKKQNDNDYIECALQAVSRGLRRCLILAEDYLTRQMTDQEKNAYIDNLTALINNEIKKGIVDAEFNIKRG